MGGKEPVLCRARDSRLITGHVANRIAEKSAATSRLAGIGGGASPVGKGMLLERRSCRICGKDYTPSSRHADCPKCRREMRRRRCRICGEPTSKDYDRCLSCAGMGNSRASKGRFSFYLRKARLRGRGFDLDEQYLEDVWSSQDGRCALSGLPLSLRRDGVGQKSGLASASLDRIKSSEGYVRGNVQFVAYSLNLAKQSFSDEAFRSHLIEIANSVLSRDERNSGHPGPQPDTGATPVISTNGDE